MSQEKKTAIVLVNLGTPAEPTASSVSAFLSEFLADKRVIEGKGPKRWLWLAVLHGIVLRIRPKKVAKLYREIWQNDSPMRTILLAQVAALQAKMDSTYQEAPKVYPAMTYGEPNLNKLLKQLHEDGTSQVYIMPLFPQYSATSTGPVYDAVANFQKNTRNVLDVRILKNYFQHEKYIQSLAATIKEHWQTNKAAEKLLFSYHGIPQQYADDGDPYPEQCFKTTQLVKECLEKEGQSYSSELISSFQSRFGFTKWVEPYTDVSLEEFAHNGVKSIDVICPAFSADCLETLEEIAQTNKELFIDNGGEVYRYIPALNDHPMFIEALFDIAQQQVPDWLGEKNGR